MVTITDKRIVETATRHGRIQRKGPYSGLSVASDFIRLSDLTPKQERLYWDTFDRETGTSPFAYEYQRF